MRWTRLLKRFRLFLFIVLVMWGREVAAQTPALTNKHYKITSWTTDDGLPGNSCVKIIQDKKGFIWLGSFDGLVRFDGTRFLVYNKGNLLSTNYAVAIADDENGNLWIGTDQGLMVYRNGKFINLADSTHAFFIESLCIDEKHQKIWLGSRNGGLFTYDMVSNTYTQVENSGEKDIINDFLKDKDGSIWVGGEKNGLLHFSQGQWNQFNESHGLLNKEIKSLYQDKAGVLYVGTSSGLYKRRPDGKFDTIEKFKGVRVSKVTMDTEGNLWVGTVNGLYHEQSKNNWRYITQKNGLSNNDIREIFFDEEGSVWLGTYRGGINQMRETKFHWYFGGQEPQIEATGALCALDDKTLLVGTTQGGLFTIKDEQLSEYPIKTEIDQRIYSILQDTQKNIWMASYNGLVLKTPDGREKLFTEKDGLRTNQIRKIFQDRNNNYWIGTRNVGLIKMSFKRFPDQPVFEQYLYDELNNFNATFIMAINEDSKGNLLVCSNNGGIVIISPDGKLKNYSKADGLKSNTCFNVREDSDGIIWVTTTNGLTRLHHGKLFTFTRSEGMPHENPMDVMEDALGFMWLPTQKGTIRVSKQQLDAFAEGKSKNIEWKLFDKNNDLAMSECTGTAQALIHAGKIWFPMIGGLMSVDPAAVQISKKAPRVFIEGVTVDELSRDITKPVLVPAGSKRIAFDFIALTLLYPNSARYRYKLDNFDGDWIEGGLNRQTSYTSLPYGNYFFKVSACNNDGVWSEASTPVALVVRPYIYQTWWFFVFVVMLIMFIGYTYTRIRTASIKQQSERLEQLVVERTKRIAEQRDEMVTLNEELRSSQEVVLTQRDALEEKIGELAEKNEEIATMNTNLERIVDERTKVLEEQNKRLSKYAFINAHKLRAPLASILGLINLFIHDAVTEQQAEMSRHLLKSANALDRVVRSINRMLEREFGKEPQEDWKATEEVREEENATDVNEEF
jgi:ligand-binding sensor domain-containing protein